MAIPSVIRKLFDQFPLETLPAVQDTIKSKQIDQKISKSGIPTLYVYKLEVFEDHEISIEPRGLQATLLLKLTNKKHEILQSSPLANNNMKLPLLVETSAKGEKNVYTSSQAIINRWNSAAWHTPEVEVYRDFIENSLYDMWVISVILTDDEDKLVENVYMSETDLAELPEMVRKFISKEICHTSMQELLPRYPSMVREYESSLSTASLPQLHESKKDIYDRAGECVQTLSGLIESSESGFISIGPRINSTEVGLLDILVFTYVYAIRTLNQQSDGNVLDEAAAIVSPLSAHCSKVFSQVM